MNTQENWKEKIRKGDNETGIYHVDGVEYNLSEDTLITFIESLLSEREQSTYLKAAEVLKKRLSEFEPISVTQDETHVYGYKKALIEMSAELTSLGISSDKKE